MAGPNLAGFSFSPIDPPALTSGTLSGFDIAVLNMATVELRCWDQQLSPDAKAEIIAFAASGKKVIIYDSECEPPGGVNYNWLPFPFTTQNPGATGELTGILTITEDNALSHSDPSDPHYINTAAIASETDAVADMNVMISRNEAWCVDMAGENVDGEFGPVHAYANYPVGSDAGLFIYNGLDVDYMEWWDPAAPGPANLSKIWELELKLPIPAGLPCYVPTIGITLSPEADENPVGEAHTVTARVFDQRNVPKPDVNVSFEVLTGGPNAGLTGTGTTDTNGEATFTYTGDGGLGVDEIEACFTDDEGEHCATATKTWINLPPTADPNGPYVGDEGSPVSFDGTGSSDPEGGPLTYEWDFGDGSPTVTGATPSHTYPDNDTYTVCLTVTDPFGESDTECTTATIASVAPCCGDITGLPTGPVQVGTPVFASAEFTDPGTNDIHTAEWDWGDNGSVPGTVDEVDGSGTVGPDSHTYTAAGIYTVELTVTDDDGDACTKSFEYIVVFDPDGGFVTGGGWIESPAGAYTPDPDLTGKATFGFVAKYKKGQSTPDGNTEFQFHAAGMNFHSSSYDWLVVTGSNFARFKGEGTINGDLCPVSEGGDLYKFMLWAGDDDPDTFRIKIWCEDGGESLVYDNGMNQPISGGSIVIHTKGK
ncbi:PKD domain-containing protein [Gemmatimonadota bacterium]